MKHGEEGLGCIDCPANGEPHSAGCYLDFKGMTVVALIAYPQKYLLQLHCKHLRERKTGSSKPKQPPLYLTIFLFHGLNSFSDWQQDLYSL